MFPLQIEQTSSSALIQWKHPNNHGERINEYNIEVMGLVTSLVNVKRPDLPVFFDNSVSRDASVIGDARDSDDDSDSDDDEEGQSELEVVEDTEGSSSASSNRFSEDTMEHRLTGLTADASFRFDCD